MILIKPVRVATFMEDIFMFDPLKTVLLFENRIFKDSRKGPFSNFLKTLKKIF